MVLAPELGEELDGWRHLYPGMKTEPQAFAQIEERKHNNLEPTEETLSLKPLGHVVRPQGEPNNPLRIEWRIFLILWFL